MVLHRLDRDSSVLRGVSILDRCCRHCYYWCNSDWTSKAKDAQSVTKKGRGIQCIRYLKMDARLYTDAESRSALCKPRSQASQKRGCIGWRVKVSQANVRGILARSYSPFSKSMHGSN